MSYSQPISFKNQIIISIFSALFVSVFGTFSVLYTNQTKQKQEQEQEQLVQEIAQTEENIRLLTYLQEEFDMNSNILMKKMELDYKQECKNFSPDISVIQDPAVRSIIQFYIAGMVCEITSLHIPRDRFSTIKWMRSVETPYSDGSNSIRFLLSTDLFDDLRDFYERLTIINISLDESRYIISMNIALPGTVGRLISESQLKDLDDNKNIIKKEIEYISSGKIIKLKNIISNEKMELTNNLEQLKELID